jgi:hypothetical protein
MPNRGVDDIVDQPKNDDAVCPARPTSAVGTKRTSRRRSAMSAFWSNRFLSSECPFDPYNAQSGVKVYVDVQDHAVRPTGKRAKVGHRFSGYRDARFNLDSHVVAIAEKKLLHILDCVG